MSDETSQSNLSPILSRREVVSAFPYLFAGLSVLSDGRPVLAQVVPALFVAETGDNITGTGEADAPFRQPSVALARANPGDSIVLRPGVYEPFEIPISGHPDQPITVTTLPGEEHQAIIDGTKFPNIAGVRILNKSFVTVENVTIRNIIGASGVSIASPMGLTGNHVIQRCIIHDIDQSAIRCVGLAPGKYDGLNSNIYTENVTLRANEIYNAYKQGGPGNEVITVGGGVRNIITEDNDIHDCLQFGIDYKRGVDGGTIRNNRIWNIEKHAIYLDTSRSFLRDIAIYGNRAWNCNNGLVLAREAQGQQTQVLENIDAYNNIFFNMRRFGMLCYAHPGDGPYGAIRNIRLRFNTIYNCANSNESLQEIRLVDWAAPEYQRAGVVSGFDVIGNLVWRDALRGRPQVLDQFSGNAGFTVVGNFNMQTEDATGFGLLSYGGDFADPMFADQHAPTPDFNIQSGSPARGVVVGYNVAPFNFDIAGQPRPYVATAGAFSGS